MSAKRFCVSQSIGGALNNWTGREWTKALDWCTRSDGSPFRSGEELEHEFQKLYDAGARLLPFGDCNNHDPAKGCLGHPIPDFQPGSSQ